MKPSEKTLLLLTIILNTSVFSQVQCVSCYQQNQRIGTAAANLIVNGSFEISNCPTWTSPYQNTFCTNSSYPHCTINNWLPTGGGVNTYAWLYDSTHSFIADGLRAVYFGNFFCAPCGTYGDTSCLSNNGCISTLPMGNPVSIVSGYGDTTGVSLQQTISGLIVGNTYVLEFWAGGEGDTVSNINKPSVFAVDIAFGNITLRNKPTYSSSSIGTRYIIQFKATGVSHTVKFTNWGHICPKCTELVLDDVLLYSLSDLPASYHCTTGIYQESLMQEVSVSPNPSNGVFIFDSLSDKDLVEVFDITGRIIQSEICTNNTHTIDISNKAKGIYLYRITQSGGRVQQGKLVLQ